MSATRWVEFEGKKYTVSDGQTALDAMLRGGANLFFSCRKGSCRSCMLEAVSGDPGEAAYARLPDDLRDLGFFLPCVATDPDQVVSRTPDLSRWVMRAGLAGRSWLTEGVLRVLLEPEQVLDWRPGQYISLRHPSGAVRSYSIASHPGDYYVELHIRVYPDGAVSPWLAEGLEIGDLVEFTGPVGSCYYSDDLADLPLVMLATGTGAGAILGIARETLRRDPAHEIHLYHGSATEAGLYLQSEFAALAAAHPNARATCLASRERANTRATEQMLSDHPDLQNKALFLCGNANMVEAARIGAVERGIELARIFADPFEPPTPYAPQDIAKIAAFPPSPEMWAALDEGAMLTRILTDFYDRVFEDPRLAPFFYKVTKQRLIEKQFAFTRDLLLGKSDYFGERPFNSHHWMIISDALFDYREQVFFEVVRAHGLPEKFVRVWAGLNERFRREIVKSTERGQIMDGKEHFRNAKTREAISVDTLCDSCNNEIKAGETVLLLQRTGEVFCEACSQ